MSLRLVVAEDEAVSRERLCALLLREPEVVVVAECGDGATALEAIRREKPDLAILDVEMPGVTGLDIVRQLPPSERPAIIFITAHAQHAVAAFDVHAVDFLLKPFRQDRLQAALSRARAYLASEQAASAAAWEDEPPLHRLVVRTGERMLVIPAASVDWIESAGNYAALHVGAATHLLRETLTDLEVRMAQGQFLRVSRTAVVNLDRVRELRPAPDGTYEIVLEGGAALSMTRGIREVQARLERG